MNKIIIIRNILIICFFVFLLIALNQFTVNFFFNFEYFNFDLKVFLFLIDILFIFSIFFFIKNYRDKNLKNYTKIILINILIFIILIIPLEAIFGNWFSDNNLNKLNIIRDKTYKVKLNELYDFEKDYVIYKRDKYGLRGIYQNLNTIDIITIGGSTTDQRYISEGYTFQDILHKNFKKQNKHVEIVNAGIDGQSSYGHIKNFELWFPLLPNFQPKYYLFFIGINDFYINDLNSYDIINYNNKKGSLLKKIYYKYKQHSALSYLINILEKTIAARNYGITHDLKQKTNFNKSNWTTQGLLTNYEQLLKVKILDFKKRLEKLIDLVNRNNGKVIFVSQSERRKYDFINNKLLGTNNIIEINDYKFNGIDYFYMSRFYIKAIKEISDKNNVLFLNLDEELNFDIEKDFYDNSHFNHNGAEKIGNYLYAKLNSLF